MANARISAAEVAAFLKETPEFFQNHPEVLAELALPSESGDAVSLLHHQLAVLQQQKSQLKDRLEELVAIASENDRLYQRMHKLTLKLLGLSSLQEMIHAIDDALLRVFLADTVALLFLDPPGDARLEHHVTPVDRDDPEFAWFSSVLSQREPLCGHLKLEQLTFLFGRDKAEALASAALLPLGESQPFGLLAIASIEPDRFSPRKGTEFLARMGQILSRILQPYLEAEQRTG